MNDYERRLDSLKQAQNMIREARDLIRLATWGTDFQLHAEMVLLPHLRKAEEIDGTIRGIIKELGRIHYEQCSAYIEELKDQYLNDGYKPEHDPNEKGGEK